MRNVLWRPQGSYLCVVSLFTCFDHFIGVSAYSVGRSMDSNEELFLTQNYFSQEVLEPNFSMGCIVDEIGNDPESDPQTLSTNI